jgi:hypothetical protein
MGLALLLDACGPSSWITSSWKAQEAVPREYKKIVVVGLIRENDRSLREKMEQHLVGDLKDLGYEAICSCEEYSPKAFENMGEEKVIEKLRDSGADAVLTVVLLDKSRERYYVPGRIYYSPYAVYHHRFYGYYHTMYTRVYSPGYYVDDTKYFWESNLYDLKTQQLVYSAQSRSFDPSSAEDLGHEYGQMIINDLVKNKVLQDHQGPSLKAM